MVDAAALADRLPDRPLKPEEAQDIADGLDASLQTLSYETENGTAYVPTMFLFVPTGDSNEHDDDLGDAVGLHMDDDMTEWFGEVQAESVTMDKWLKVNEMWAAEMGLKMGDITMFGDDGTERELRD